MGINVKKEMKYRIINSRFVSLLVYWVLSLYMKTLRITVEDQGEFEEYLKRGGRIILASWHQRFFGGCLLSKELNKSICIMISRSRDGDFIADVVRRMGWIPARGSSSRGGRGALKEMIKIVAQNRLGAHIVDGPTGPPRIIKPGLISMAQKSAAAICPVYVFYESGWICNSWDEFIIPKPFSNVLIRMGSLETAPEELSEKQFEDLRKNIEQKMIDGYKMHSDIALRK